MSTNGEVCREDVAAEDEAAPLLSSQEAPSRVRGASFTSSVFNLMNAIMGSGILGLAYAMANTGIIGFCILLVLVSTMAAYSIHLLLKLCDQTGITSYEDLGLRALHRPGKVIVAISILIQNMGAMASYLFILKSELPASITSFLSSDTPRDVWYLDGRVLLVLITVCVVLPLSMLTKIGLLGYTSSLAFFFMLYFTAVVVIKKWSIPCPQPLNTSLDLGVDQFAQNSSDPECSPKLFVFSSKSAYAIPTMAFSFLCHTAILPIYCELDRPSKSRMQKVSNVGIGLSFLVYLVSALFGYLTFYSHVNSELLQGYHYLPRDVVVLTVRLAILLSVLLTVPLIHFPARKAAILLLCGSDTFSWLIHVTATIVILGVVLTMAVLVPDIKNVFGVVGSTTSSLLLFVFPGIFYFRISNEPLRSPDTFGAAILVVLGVLMGAASFSVIVITWVQSS
ncbi:putative sodium-coupled neutral amino acid transporter 6 isoform 1-T1 [Synchiropus picturatus]